MEEKRIKNFHIRITETEEKKLEYILNRLGTKKTKFLVTIINKMYNELNEKEVY